MRPTIARCVLTSLALVPLLLASSPKALAQDKITIAALPFVSSSPIFIAQEKGYFADAGIEVEIEFFRAAQPVAVAIASGDADFGVTALTAGLFNLAGKGALKIIGAQLHEKQGFAGSAILVSNEAFDAGFTSVDQFSGKSIAISQIGSSFHYMIGQIAEQAGFPLDEVTLQPLQAVPNMISALKTSQVDAMIIVPHIAKPLDNAGAAHIIGWVADYAPYQVGALFTSTALVDDNPDLVGRFVEAYQSGIADYREAFLRRDAAGAPIYDDLTDEVVGIVHNYVYSDQPAEKAGPRIRNGAMYIEEQGRLDVADVYDQISWYKDQGLVDGDLDPATIIDTSFIEPLTEPK